MKNQTHNHTKPRAKVLGQDGNVFNILAICSRALKRAGLHEEDEAMKKEVFESGSYHEALGKMMEYVDME